MKANENTRHLENSDWSLLGKYNLESLDQIVVTTWKYVWQSFETTTLSNLLKQHNAVIWILQFRTITLNFEEYFHII